MLSVPIRLELLVNNFRWIFNQRQILL